MEIQDTVVSAPEWREACVAPPAQGNWFALSVKSRHEKVVTQLLTNKGFETFLPLYTRRHEYARRAREFELPLFPGYLFCRFDAGACLPILTTPGVLRVVGSGRAPIPVDNDEVAALQKAIAAKVAMTPHPYWRSGQRGRITSGALAGVEGVVVSGKQPMKLILSVSLLQRSVLLEIDASRVELAAETHACGAW
jgi:transcription antitermination factor NusG